MLLPTTGADNRVRQTALRTCTFVLALQPDKPMYTQFFRLTHTPFSIAPDPRYVYMSERHREALAHLLYGIDGGGGFVLLTGEIGAGKTTICRCFLEQVPDNCNVAYIFNPKLSVLELLRTICEEFHIDMSGYGLIRSGIKEHVDALNRFLLTEHAAGRNNVLIIDEAQNLSADVLEQLRLLTNLETSERKLLQIILIGQPELRRMIKHPKLEQLAQRVIARYHLGPLTESEIDKYIGHRLTMAGLVTASPFQPNLMQAIHQATKGVPRRINLLCDRALLGAYAENKQEVDRRILSKAAREVFGHADTRKDVRAQRWHYALAGLLLAGGAAAAIVWNMQGISARKLTTDKPVVAAKAAPSESVPMTVPAAMPTLPNVPATATEAPPPAVALDPHDVHAAMRQLARLWNVTLNDGSQPCDSAQANNLHCYISSGGLVELRQLDRPAVVTLHDDSGRTYYAILTALNDADATLRIGGYIRKLGLVTLSRQFDGAFATFWRAPRDYRPRISLGERSEEVDWIAQQLAKLNDSKVDAKASTGKAFDEEMAKQVREFQFAQGLKADGMIGPRTIMQLNRAAGVEEPRLQASLTPAVTRK